jgi:DHA2 family multidrug resistance protein
MKKINPWIVVFSVLLGTSIEMLDTTVANIALPHIAGSLSVTPEEATWVLTSYLISNGIVLPTAAWLAGRFGRKKYFLSSLVLFMISSIFCGFAPSLTWLIVFRIFQGLGGGGLQPTSNAILLETFPPEKRGQAVSVYGLALMLFPMLGPLIGGWITDHYTWRWIFFINIPIGLVALLLVSLFLFDPPYLKRTKDPVDYLGLGFLMIGIALLQYCLDKGQEKGWLSSHLIATFFVISGLFLFFFVVWELITPKPIVDLRILKDRTFAIGCILVIFLFQGLFATLVTIPLYLQLLLGYTAFQAGTATLPRGIGTLVAMPITGFVLMSYFDARFLMAAGAVSAGIFTYLLSRLNLQISYWNLFWPQFFLGLSMPLIFAPLQTITYGDIPKEKMGAATSLRAMIRNIGSSIGISIATTLLQSRAQEYQTALAQHVSSGSTLLSSRIQSTSHYFLQHGYSLVNAQIMAKAKIFSDLTTQGNFLSYLVNFRIFALFFIPFVLFVGFLKKLPLQKRQER